METKNIISKILPNSFDVITLNENGSSKINVTAKGNLKKSIKICVGDYCEIENNVITKILPRKNKLLRPDCANIDNLVIVVTKKPMVDLFVVDLMLGEAKRQNINPIIVVNKMDLPNSKNFFNKIYSDYSDICTVLEVSSKTGENVDLLKKMLTNITAFGGQSGVGKSSLINALYNLNLKVGELSKISRGTHTTKESYFYISDNNKIIIDTAGFSNFNVNYLNLTIDGLKEIYSDINSKNCKFKSCTHSGELGCFYNSNKTPRFLRYKELENQIKNFSYKIRKGGNKNEQNKN